MCPVNFQVIDTNKNFAHASGNFGLMCDLFIDIHLKFKFDIQYLVSLNLS